MKNLFIFLSDEVHLFNLRTLSTPNANEKPNPSALLILHRQGEDCERNNTGGFLPKFRYGFKLNVNNIKFWSQQAF